MEEAEAVFTINDGSLLCNSPLATDKATRPNGGAGGCAARVGVGVGLGGGHRGGMAARA